MPRKGKKRLPKGGATRPGPRPGPARPGPARLGHAFKALVAPPGGKTLRSGWLVEIVSRSVCPQQRRVRPEDFFAPPGPALPPNQCLHLPGSAAPRRRRQSGWLIDEPSGQPTPGIHSVSELRVRYLLGLSQSWSRYASGASASHDVLQLPAWVPVAACCLARRRRMSRG